MDPEHAYFNESWRNAYPLEYLPNGPHDHVSAPAPYFSAQKRLKIWSRREGTIQLSKSEGQPAMLREAAPPPRIDVLLPPQLTKVDVS